MLLGYNTNGFADHDPLDALELLAEIGYRSVALTLDHGLLDPFADGLARRLARVRASLEKLGLRSVVETGARFLLDPRAKHEPTLVSTDPAGLARRIDFLKRAIDAAHALHSDCVSLWSGAARDGAGEAELFDRLTAGLADVLDYAADRGVVLGFEPEPGMFIDTMARFAELSERVASRGTDAERFRLTLDIGHLHCQREWPLADQIAAWGPRLVNVHLEDMRAGVHEHLMFGEGEIDFPPVIQALKKTGYSGGVHVELSRHSHEAPQAARRAFEFLQPLVANE